MNINLAYGKKGLEVILDDDLDVTIVQPKHSASLEDPDNYIEQALKNPINSKALSDYVKSSDKIGIIFSDITRPMPRQLILSSIFKELNFVPNDNFVLFNALGTHRPNTKDELIEMLGQDICENYKIVQNNSFDKSTQVKIGRSVRNHDIWLNKELVDCDFLILTGFIEPHFFAGFSGGGKAIMPGMAGIETVCGNHDAKMIANPNSTWGITNGNPIWEEVNEVAELIENKFLLNVALNNKKEITEVFAGELKEAHRVGCNAVKETSMAAVDQLFDIVITTNSGYPLDLNLYQTIKGLSGAAKIVKENGTIIVASECWDGIPEHGLFGQLLSESNSPSKLLEKILNSPVSKPDQWQAQIQAQIQLKADVFIYTENLTKTQIEDSLLKPCEDIAELVRDIQSKSKEKLKICVLPEGPQTIPYLL